MLREDILRRVGLVHAALLAVFGLGLAASGFPVKGILLGGGAMALSAGFLWGTARAVIDGRRAAVLAFGTLKFVTYLGLVVLVLGGRLHADGVGFAIGITCFLVATVIVALFDRGGNGGRLWSTD